MAHKEQKDFCIKIKQQFPEYFENKKVLDIGSLDINGNNTFLFKDCNYIGLDVGEGRNVDIVSVGHLYDGPDEYFDTIISTEVFEHDMFYEETIQNIMRMLKPGGAFIFTCASTGRPEHGTRKCGEWCAPLLIQISEEWADYYKNLTEDDIRKIKNFETTFPDGIFEYLLYPVENEQHGDLYFFGIKGGINKKNKYDIKSPNSILTQKDYEEKTYADDIFVVGCWPDTEEKEKDLIGCIQRLKEFKGIPILLASHYPVKPEIQEMVDYYLFDKDNPLLNMSEYQEYNVSSGFWVKDSKYKFESKNLFHHDYAIWILMQKTFKFCDNLGKKTIHYLEYDNLIDTFQYKQAFLEKSKEYDAVIYEYNEKSSSNFNLTEYMATYIFSAKTEILLKMIGEINSKWEYFHNRPGGFQLERIFLANLRKHTNDVYVSPYVANNDELNTQAVWNRDGIKRNDAAFRIHLGVDEHDDLYLCLLHGFFDYNPDEEYLIEYRYGDKNAFVKLSPNKFEFINIGKYTKGKTLYVNYNGIEVFREFLGLDSKKYREINTITTIDNNLVEKKNIMNKINYHFVDGAFLEISGNKEDIYDVDFIDVDTKNVIFSTKIKNNQWAKTSIKYFVNWLIKIKASNGDEKEIYFNPTQKNILISFESFALGDTIAWMPYAQEFMEKNNCSVIVSTPHGELFKSEYPNLQFVLPGTVVHNLYAHYKLGVFDNNGEHDLCRNRKKPNELSLQGVAADILGLEHTEIKTKIKKMNPFESDKPYICIGFHSTCQTKYWNNPTGWQELVDYVKSNGYDVYVLSKEEDGYMGNTLPDGVIHIQNKTIEEIGSYLIGSECFVGISSGLSWYSWALNVPTILISGFTDENLEMKKDVVRIINKSVCNGCWSRHSFDRGDWNWCPEHKDTDRQFECSKTITFDMVRPHIDNFLKKIMR